jgi:MFS family permease
MENTWKPKHNPWIIAITVTLATIMEVLDTSIANVALPHIAGSLGASQDESTWVITSYLVANAIVLPAGAYLGGIVGRKRFYMICLVIFGVSSLLCGVAPSLPRCCFSALFKASAEEVSNPPNNPYWPTLSAREARSGICCVWIGRDNRPDCWPDAGWLDHGQLQLALDLLH